MPTHVSSSVRRTGSRLPIAVIGALWIACAARIGFAQQKLEFLDNILGRASFEEDRDRDGFPDGWTANRYESKGEATWDRAVTRTGKRSVRLAHPGRGDSKNWQTYTVRWYSRVFPIEPGTRYDLEAWVKTRGVDGRAYIHIAWMKGSKWLSEQSSAPLRGTGDWRRVRVSAAAPAGADSARVALGLARGNGTVWFDDVRVSGRSLLPPRAEYHFSDTANWFRFPLLDEDVEPSTIDLRGYLDAPAGKFGFLHVEPDGHFYFGNGKRARFFGVNLGGRDCLPTKEKARVIARHFAKYGVNLVRLHSLDSRYAGLIDYTKGDSRHFDPEQLDRLDYLIAQLKAQGIYVYLDLLDYRMFRDADGVAEGDAFTPNWAGSMKGASIFDERMIELQKEYATALLTHENPYTHRRYVDDPAIAMIEMTNENSVFYFLLMKGLSRPYYREQLRQRWNRWLQEKYRDHRTLARAWNADGDTPVLGDDESLSRMTVRFPAAELIRYSRGAMRHPESAHWEPPRIRDAIAFLGDLQNRYFEQIRTHLRDSVGVRAPITGTNQVFILKDLRINANWSDFISRNQYWNHPNVHAKPFMLFDPRSILNVDLPTTRTPLAVFAASSVVGKPMVLSEFNFPWPNAYRAEGLLLATAYACLQDWDAVLLFSYQLDAPSIDTFRSQADPARWGTFPAAAHLFHRHDVQTARHEIDVIHTEEAVDGLQPDCRYAPADNFRFLTFLSKTRHAFAGDGPSPDADAVLAAGPSARVRLDTDLPVIRIGKNPGEAPLYRDFLEQAAKAGLDGYRDREESPGVFLSDTGELSWNFRRGTWMASARKTKLAMGFFGDDQVVDLDTSRSSSRPTSR